MTITTDEVSAALEGLNFEKAIAWDLIPGTVFSLVHKIRSTHLIKHQQCCYQIAYLLNEMVRLTWIDSKVACGRLVCLNKVFPQIPTVESGIRPICVFSFWIKLLEKVILTSLVKDGNVYSTL